MTEKNYLSESDISILLRRAGNTPKHETTWITPEDLQALIFELDSNKRTLDDIETYLFDEAKTLTDIRKYLHARRTVHYRAIGRLPKEICPNCGAGEHGVDPLCDECWKWYLGTHVGGR